MVADGGSRNDPVFESRVRPVIAPVKALHSSGHLDSARGERTLGNHIYEGLFSSGLDEIKRIPRREFADATKAPPA